MAPGDGDINEQLMAEFERLAKDSGYLVKGLPIVEAMVAAAAQKQAEQEGRGGAAARQKVLRDLPETDNQLRVFEDRIEIPINHGGNPGLALGLRDQLKNSGAGLIVEHQGQESVITLSKEALLTYLQSNHAAIQTALVDISGMRSQEVGQNMAHGAEPAGRNESRPAAFTPAAPSSSSQGAEAPEPTPDEVWARLKAEHPSRTSLQAGQGRNPSISAPRLEGGHDSVVSGGGGGPDDTVNQGGNEMVVGLQNWQGFNEAVKGFHRAGACQTENDQAVNQRGNVHVQASTVQANGNGADNQIGYIGGR